MSESVSESVLAGTDNDPLAVALRWLAAGRRVAVASVMSTSGGPFPPSGSLLAVAEDGSIAGSVSGGCIEDSVARQALRAIADGEQRVLAYTVTDAVARAEAGLAAGGRIELYLDPVDPGGHGHRLLERVAAARAEGQPVVLVFDLITGLKTLVYPHAVHGAFGLDEPVLEEIRCCLAEGRCAVLEPGEEGRLFVQVFGGGATKFA